MKRRTFLVAAGVGAGGLVVGASGVVLSEVGSSDSDASETPAKDVPKAVKAVQPLAEAFHARITAHFESARVFITQDATIAMEYATETETADSLRTEFNQIADVYAEVAAEGHEPTTLSIVTGSVQGLVPESSLKAYLQGEINEDAYLETVEVMSVERHDD
jgi:hypothetical protein